MLISDKQRDANRNNARRSTGPRTPAGKLRASRNAITHGAHVAAALVIPELGEKTQDAAALLDGLFSDWQPVTTQQALLIGEIAACAWKLRRLRRTEAAYYTAARTRCLLRPDAAIRHRQTRGGPVDEASLLGEIALSHAAGLESFSRQQARLLSLQLRLVRDLSRLETGAGGERQNKPQLSGNNEPGPQPTETTRSGASPSPIRPVPCLPPSSEPGQTGCRSPAAAEEHTSPRPAARRGESGHARATQRPADGKPAAVAADIIHRIWSKQKESLL